MTRRIHHVHALKSPIAGTEVMSLHTDHAFPRHSHDHFGIGVITQGTQRSWSLQGKIEVEAGDIIIVNPGEIHDGSPLDGARSWQMIYLQPELLYRELAADDYCGIEHQTYIVGELMISGGRREF